MAAPRKYTKTIFALMIVMAIFLVCLDMVLVSQERNKIYADFNVQAQNEFTLIETFVTEPLLHEKFTLVEQFIMQWGDKNIDIVKLQAFSPHGFLLTEFQRSTPAKDTVLLRHSVHFRNKHLLDLQITKDLLPIESRLQRFLHQLILQSLFSTMLLGVVLWIILKVMALRPLETEIAKRKQTEKLLQNSKGQLEVQVEERTFKLQQQKKRLEVITDNIPGVVYQLYARSDGETGARYVSPKLSDIFGLEFIDDPSALLQSFIDNIHQEDRQSFIDSINEIVERLIPWEWSGRYIKPSGETIWFEGHTTAPNVRNDEVIFNGILLDITERKLTEQAIVKSQEEWKKTFNAIPDIITLQDKNMHIVRANKAAYDFLAMKDENFIGKNCYEVFSGTSQPCPGCPGISALQDTHSHSQIIEHKNLGKTFLVSSSPIFGPNKEMQYLVHVAKDITEQKRLEEELFQSHKMEAIGTLAGGIAHDFNNILSVIIGFSEIMQADLQTGRSNPEHIDQIINAGKRATELVKQILTFSHKTEHLMQPLSPHLIVKEAMKMLRASLPATIDIQQNIDSGCGNILADPTKIHQVVVNLCTNALHAMEDEKGTLSISLGHKDVGAEQVKGRDVSPGDFIVLSISDTGHGMDKKTITRIFEPYFTTKKRGKGTGLGLAVIHGIIKEHKGFIEVESEPNKGTSFHVYIPALTKDSIVQDITAGEDIILPSGTEKILIVDDEDAIVEINKKALECLGYIVTTTTDSLNALVKIRSNPDQFDLLITDQTMPNMTGSELAQEVMKIKPNMPIILSTGYSAVISEDEALALGIKKFAKKPVNQATLAKLVRQTLDEN